MIMYDECPCDKCELRIKLEKEGKDISKTDICKYECKRGGYINPKMIY